MDATPVIGAHVGPNALVLPCYVKHNQKDIPMPSALEISQKSKLEQETGFRNTAVIKAWPVRRQLGERRPPVAKRPEHLLIDELLSLRDYDSKDSADAPRRDQVHAGRITGRIQPERTAPPDGPYPNSR